MVLSSTERQLLHEVRAEGDRLYKANEETNAAHVYSAAITYIRSMAASALKEDRDDISLTQIAFAMKEKHQDIIVPGSLLLDKASCLGGLYFKKLDQALISMLACTVNSPNHIREASRSLESEKVLGGAGKQRYRPLALFRTLSG